MRRRDPDAARETGLALMLLRRSRGMTLHQVSEVTGVAPCRLSSYEAGRSMPRSEDTLQSILRALGLPAGVLSDARCLVYEAQRLTGEVNGGQPEDGDGALPPDTRTHVSRKDALRLAQQAGRAVAHCCLAFMELQAGGWPGDANHNDSQPTRSNA
ncbi:MAG TPA: helix-turn-helix transcriptional regulator [Thermoanaerobaculia bacterium]